MKEFKFKEIQGFEEQSLPRQLDDFEAKGSKNQLKTRYAFDFSGPSGFPILSDDNPAINYFGKRHFPNLASPAATQGGNLSDPGWALLMVKNVPYYTDGNLHPQNTHITQTVPDISGERDVAYWNENAMIYLDDAVKGVLGTGGTENYIKQFRTGYVEFTFKTNKLNCLIGMGSLKRTDYGFKIGPVSVGPDAENTGPRMSASAQVVIDEKTSYLTDDLTNTDTMYINLNNGRLELKYTNEYGNTKKEFTILGDTNLADDQWHHVVVNFNKPGVVDVHGTKINKKFIEFWIDGQLEKKEDKYINDNHVFFPIIEWLLMDPLLATKIDLEAWQTFDRSAEDERFLGYAEFRVMKNRAFNDAATPTAFRGAFNHYISGVNYPLTKYEIQQRNRLFRFYDRNDVDLFTASAELITPSVLTNKKKALKLFWNNLINDSAKNGIELDNKYSVESYSVTHKILNSKTEVNNLDIASSKTLTFLKDVRAVFKDNVNLFGPGRQNFYNRPEIWGADLGEQYQLNMTNYPFDGLNSISLTMAESIQSRLSDYGVVNMPFSGLILQNGDRILLTNQFNKKDNGVYIFNGISSPLVRADDAFSPNQLQNAVVRVVDGYYKDTSWRLLNSITSMSDVQNWVELEYHPSSEDVLTQPIFESRWSDDLGNERFIDLEQDLNVSNYDLIVFMNYPENSDDVTNHLLNKQPQEVKIAYDNFIKSLKNVAAQGASLYVSSPKLATDLGIVKEFTVIDQQLQDSDAQSAAISPFEISEPASNYFDTHRINQYQLVTEVAGLTNKETYILTDFINYTPNNNYDYEQYHAKYSYRQLGLKEGNQFIIPGLALREVTQNENRPGFNQNQKSTKPILAVAPQNVLSGTVVTELANNYYNGSTVTANPYDDYATTIIVHNNQLLGTQPISGKIFVNCVEDGYTFSREEYNKAVIQVVPTPDSNETTATRQWQYSTSRLDRKPRQVNVRELTKFGQTTPSNGGGGPFIQAPSNSANGIIRSQSDSGNINYQSDLYPEESEEIYTTQVIPVLSMTWLGLQWLAE